SLLLTSITLHSLPTRRSSDLKNAEKIIELYEKDQKDEFIIGFSGHFSAGKSSMINALLEKEILPKSPIPTSANIVKITSGDGVARIYFHHERSEEHTSELQSRFELV